jgi:hypothetical protein
MTTSALQFGESDHLGKVAAVDTRYLSGELLGVARTESVGAGWSLRESA